MSYNKLFPLEITKRIYLFSLFLTVILSLIFAMITEGSQIGMELAGGEKDLTRAASVLDKLLTQSFQEILVEKEGQDLSKTEQIEILNLALQPYIQETSQLYPELSMGFFSAELNSPVAFGPNFSMEQIEELGKSLPGASDQLYGGGSERKSNNTFLWEDDPQRSFYQPLQRNGEVIGYVWTRFSVRPVYERAVLDGLLIFGAGLLLTLGLVGFFWIIFTRFRRDLEDFSHSLASSGGNLQRIYLPELNPILEEARRYQHSTTMETIAQFAASVAHEIKNPLTTVRGFSQLLLDKESDPAKRVYLGFIIREADRLNGFSSNFLCLTKTGKTRLEVLNAEDLLQQVEQLVQGSCSNANVQLRLDIKQPGLGLIGDSHQLCQVLLNLIFNSLQALENQDEGKIDVTAYGVGGNVHIQVTDNGPGMSTRQLSKIFKPFYTTKNSGTGLGLTVSKHLIEQQGGTIEAISRPGLGTTVTISLRRNQEPVSSKAQSRFFFGFSK